MNLVMVLLKDGHLASCVFVQMIAPNKTQIDKKNCTVGTFVLDLQSHYKRAT